MPQSNPSSTRFRCHVSYGCRCSPGRVVKLRTAQRHRKKALDQVRAVNHMGNILLPLPQSVRVSTPPGDNGRSLLSGSQLDEGSATDWPAFDSFLSPAEQRAASELSTGRSPDPEIMEVEHRQSLAEFSRCETAPDSVEYSLACSSAIVPVSNEPIERSYLSDFSPISYSMNNGIPLDYSSSRFRSFMEKHARLVGIYLKHQCTTNALMDDLLQDDGSKEYISWAGVKAALLRSSGLELSQHLYCSHGHQALGCNEDDTVIPCKVGICANIETPPKAYTYIGLWQRLEAWMQSETQGPLLYNYYRQGIQIAFSKSGDPRFIDFFSGNLFKEAVAKLGGPDSVKDDIFLILSTDGVQAYKSNEYSYWPVVVMVANLPPWDRSKIRHILPVAVIPGPKAPGDLVSFLNPFLSEMEELSKGRRVRMWDGSIRKVRVHLLFATADLPAVAKLGYLKGHSGLSPCRFCNIQGVFVQSKKHVYYPDRIPVKPTIAKSRRRKTKRLWDSRSLPMRTESSIESELHEPARVEKDGTRAEFDSISKTFGYSSSQMSPLIKRMPHFRPFRSFPINIMHLLYANIAPNVISLWLGSDPNLIDVSFLSESHTFKLVDDCLTSAGKNINSTVRNPRSLTQRKRWKAAEWKYFVECTSMVALHDNIPKTALDGWWLFVQLSRLVSKYELDERDVKRIGKLSRSFYRHFSSTYYQFDESRMHTCRFIYHLLLHLEDSIRDCGPVSLLAQWPMESYVGDTNRRCSATHLFGESVLENVKFQSTARLFSLRENVAIRHLDEDATGLLAPDNPNLFATSNVLKYDGYVFRHPRTLTSIEEASSSLGHNIRGMLGAFYVRELDYSKQGAVELLEANSELTIWSRLFQESLSKGTPTIYRSAYSVSETNSRASCYISGLFAADDDQIDMYYGRVLSFLEHRVGDDIHMLALIAWVVRDLRCGEQKQVYVQKKLDSASLFSNIRVESVHCIGYPIAVIEAKKRGRRGETVRSYFLDDLQ